MIAAHPDTAQGSPRARDYYSAREAKAVSDTSDWYTTAQAAAYLKVNQKTVQRACALGTMRACRIGEGSKAQYRVRRAWCDAWMMRVGGQEV